MYIHIAFPYCGKIMASVCGKHLSTDFSSRKENETRCVPITFVLSTNTVTVIVDNGKDLQQESIRQCQGTGKKWVTVSENGSSKKEPVQSGRKQQRSTTRPQMTAMTVNQGLSTQ